MAVLRCPVLVGRRSELAVLRSAAAAARLGGGGAHALIGPPGIGKTRVVRELAVAARAWGVSVLVGRAVEGGPGSGSGTAFRPLTEALLAGLRRRPEPDDPSLVPFRAVLGRILPQWRTDTVPDDSLVVLGEAVLRLLAVLAEDHGVVLVLEDVHWADSETLAVLEYLADNVAGEPIALVATARDEPGPATALLQTLEARSCATIVPLERLTPDEVAVMAAACVGEDVSADVLASLRRRSGGTPLLVEELLVVGVDPESVVPVTVSEAIGRRLGSMSPAARQCVRAAAVLGERFDWRMLARVLDLTDICEPLRSATAAGLIDAAGGEEFRFHHALGRDAVLSSVLPPERARWAGRGLAALLAAHPALEGAWCDVAADLALGAGDTHQAATMLLEAGRRNLACGALVSAEAVLERARRLVDDEVLLAAGIDTVLAEVLAQAGKTDEAVAAASRSLQRLRRTSGSDADFTDAFLLLARIHTAAGTFREADQHLTAARRCAGDDATRLRISAVVARVALGDARFDDAGRLAERALAAAREADMPDVACDVLLVLGRIARRGDLAAAEELFLQARSIAADGGMVAAANRALDEIAIGDVQESLRLDRLDDARVQATRLGDVAAVAVLDLQTIATHNSRWEPEQALEATARCVAASQRFQLPTLPKALVLGAAAADHLGRAADADTACAQALSLAPDDTHLRGEVWGIRAYRALAAADDAAALDLLDRAMAVFAMRANEVTGSPAVGFWVLLHTVTDVELREPLPPPDPVANRWNRGLIGFADAVAKGRRGEYAGAVSAFLAADAVLRLPIDVAWSRRQGRRLVARAALADGWGDPAGWAVEDLAVVEARGQDRWAASLRGLVRRSGGTLPRRGRGDTAVPEELQALGVTSREVDVLALVADGLGNREIARRLFLSPRTVEKHLERLVTKTRTRRRAELISYASRITHRPGS